MELEIIETGPMPVNTYILKDDISKECVIFDVGGNFEAVYSKIQSQGYIIKYILNTHGHFDHVLGETYIQKHYPEIPIFIHKDDLPHIQNLKNEMVYFGFHFDNQPLTINSFIDENSELYIGTNKICIFHTPGHSKGSLSYFVDNKVFSGDTLFYRSIGRTDFYDGNYDVLIDSIKTKLLTLPDSTIVYPGHGQSTTIKDEKNFNSYLI